MKKILCLFICTVVSVFNFFAATPRVMVAQRIGPVGGNAIDVSSPVIKKSYGETYVRYDFKVIGSDNDHGVIDCKISFPMGIEVEFDGGTGFQAIKTESGDCAALTIYKSYDSRCCEFLIPQKNDHAGYVSFKIKIPDYYDGKQQVKFYFEHFEKPFFRRWGTGLGIAAGIAVGVIVGVVAVNPAVGAAAGTAVVAGTGAATVATTSGLAILGATALGLAVATGTFGVTTYVSYNAIKESIQEVREKYNSNPMYDSNIIYSWTIK